MATCKGLTKDGQPCKDTVREGEYCWIHKSQANEQEADNVLQDDSAQQESLLLTRREFTSPDGIGRMFRWLRDVITTGIIGDAAYDALKEGIQRGGREVGKIVRESHELAKNSEENIESSITPAPVKVPTPPESRTPKADSTPIPESQYGDIRAGKLRSLQHANLSGVDLSRANLSRVDLRWANLSGANLRNANLSGAELR
jgi:hypothetical protein